MTTRVKTKHLNPSSSFAFIWILFSILFGASAAMFSKKAALLGKGEGLLASLFTPWYAGALVFLGLQACVWIMALRYFPLSFAYPFTSLLRGLTLFGAWFFFHEQVHTHEILGILIIMVGIAVIGMNIEK
jgi:drug/metabolite transporter (DMT)-like permease